MDGIFSRHSGIPHFFAQFSFLHSKHAHSLKLNPVVNPDFPLPVQVPRARGVLCDAEREPPPPRRQLLHQRHHLLLRRQKFQGRAEDHLCPRLQAPVIKANTN